MLLIFRLILSFFAGTLIWYILLILFGAPLFSVFGGTLSLSGLLCVTSVLPLVTVSRTWEHFAALIFDLKSGAESFTEFVAQRAAVGAVLGVWFGAWPIPLDWDRWWQEWPISCVFGTVVGTALAVTSAFANRYVSQRRRKQDKWKIV